MVSAEQQTVVRTPGPRDLRGRLVLAAAVPAAALMFVAVLLVFEIRSLVRTFDWVDHTDQVIATSHLTSKLMIDKETGLRGFLITGRGEFLEPFHSGSAEVRASLQRLGELVADNPGQVERLGELRRAIEAWDDYAETLLDNKVSPEKGDAYEKSLRGKMLMDDVRARIGAMVLVEETLRGARGDAAVATARESIAGSLVALLVLGLGLGWFTRRQIVRSIEAYRQALDARGAFLNLAGHELRTPVTALGLQLTSLRRELSKPAPADLDRRVDLASRQVTRLSSLITDLLDVDRLSARRVQIQPAPVVLADLVRDVVQRLAPTFELAGCPVSLDIHDVSPGEWDRTRLERALEALLSNAAKFGAGQPIEVTLHGDGNDAVLSVRDHGPGIAPGIAESLFSPFARGVSDRHYGGFGLGLFLARQIVEAHGGTLTVVSEPGAGATFTMRLPRGAGTRRDLGADAVH